MRSTKLINLILKPVNFSKKIFQQLLVLFSISLLFLSCHRDRVNNSNPYLANYGFSIQINMNLPLYSNLQFAGNSIKVDEFGVGNRGIIVFNSGSGFYAYDGACPNQALSSCSTLTLNSSSATCPCDNAVYSLFNGQAAGMQYTLKPYRAELNGTTVIVSN
jgi:nitrite reductase/ring-hydroxylating ferredoxin subunit